MKTSVAQSSSIFCEKLLFAADSGSYVRCGNYVIWPQIKIIKI